ncbi:MAG: hypothetical protein HOV83_04270, partial [Catenulispora sp.]|nr:hypothetical protein [Catenulispora sp.]
MALEQLYFTSCERGHGPVAGYQFNALSPGATAETQREVLALVGYRPPRSQAFPSGPDELRQCPVNLCFRPGTAATVGTAGSLGTPGTPAI